MTWRRVGLRSEARGRVATRILAPTGRIVVAAWCMALAACGAATGPSAQGALPLAVAVTGTTTVTAGPSGSVLRVDVTVTNQGTKAIPYDGNTCGAVSFALYQPQSHTGAAPVWRNPGMICFAYSAPGTLSPGQSVAMFAYYAPGETGLDGPPPPAGTYAVKATVAIQAGTRTVDAGMATIGE